MGEAAVGQWNEIRKDRSGFIYFAQTFSPQGAAAGKPPGNGEQNVAGFRHSRNTLPDILHDTGAGVSEQAPESESPRQAEQERKKLSHVFCDRLGFVEKGDS
jgi:hypothetical protein